MGLITILIILAIIFLPILIIYNGLVQRKNQVKNAWSGIEVQLKRRSDLIPNLVKTVKGYAKHEESIINEVSMARSLMVSNQGDVKRSAVAEDMLRNSLNKLFAIAENYPELKASENFLKLQNELARTEDEIAAARRIYNNNTRDLNIKIESFPSNMVAKIFNFQKADYFKATESEKKKILVGI